MMDSWQNIDWEKFHFLRPELLWALLPLAVILILGIISFNQKAKWKVAIAPHLRDYVIDKGNEGIRIWVQVLAFLTIALAIIGVAGPTWKEIEEPGKILQTPVIIALDLSQSMMAEDIQPSRLDRAKLKISDFLDADPQARIGLIGFAGTAHTIVPLSQDYEIIKSHLESLAPSIMPFPGSDMQAALSLCDSLASITDAPATIILFSDGFEGENVSLLQNNVSTGNKKVELVAMATRTGAEIPMPGSSRTYKDENGEAVISALDTSALAQLNSLDAIHNNPLTLDNSDMEFLAKGISENLDFKEEPTQKENDWQDEGIWLLLPMLILILLWFRKGFVIYSLLFAITLSSCSSGTTLADLFYSRDYQGQKLERKGQLEEAAERYEDPVRQGNAWYHLGDYDKAIEAYQQDTTAMGNYNLGLALYKNGDIRGAQIAFEDALQKDPQMKSAADNAAMLRAMDNMSASMDPQNAQDPDQEGGGEQAQNTENTSPEDLSGGGQEATKEDMEKERLEETVATDLRKGKEMDEVPDDFKPGDGAPPQNVLMRKVDDDPALFLQRKFKHQVKILSLQPKNGLTKW